MTKRIISSNRIFNDIDDYLSYYHTSERTQLAATHQLHAFIAKMEDCYFDTLALLERLDQTTAADCQEKDKKATNAQRAMKKILAKIDDELQFHGNEFDRFLVT